MSTRAQIQDANATYFPSLSKAPITCQTPPWSSYVTCYGSKRHLLWNLQEVPSSHESLQNLHDGIFIKRWTATAIPPFTTSFAANSRRLLLSGEGKLLWKKGQKQLAVQHLMIFAQHLQPVQAGDVFILFLPTSNWAKMIFADVS